MATRGIEVKVRVEKDKITGKKRKRDGKKVNIGGASSETNKKKCKASDVTKNFLFIETKEQLGRIRLARQKLEKWVYTPFFKRAVIGGFVRIKIGLNDGTYVYRIAEIVDVCETDIIYQLGSTTTNKVLRLKHGAEKRLFPLAFVSNQDFSDSEFQKWKKNCTIHGTSPPTLEDIEKKLKDIQEALNYEFKEADIDQMLQEKNRFRKSPHNFAMRKIQLMDEIKSAFSKGEQVEIERLKKELADLDYESSKRFLSSTSSAISVINQRSRKLNVERAEKAILEEIRSTGDGQKAEDPCIRRRTKPGKVNHRPNPEEFLTTPPLALPTSVGNDNARTLVVKPKQHNI